MLDKLEVARALREIGLLLQLQGENRFRARAYETGARVVEELREELGALVDEQRLTAVPGIGPALAATIAELWATGRSALLERLRSEVPPGALELAEVPGLSFTRIRTLHSALGIDSVAALQRACEEGRLRQVRGFGAKTEAKLLEAIRQHEERGGRVLLVDALEAAEPLIAHLRRHPSAARVEPVGALRRWQETLGGVELLAASDDAPALIDQLLAYPPVVRTVARDQRHAAVRLSSGLRVELTVAAPARFAGELVRLSGAPGHVARVAELLAARGRSLDDPARDEAEVYAAAGLPLIAPELREDENIQSGLNVNNNIQSGLNVSKNIQAGLIVTGDVRGMTHCHTVYSDGKASVEEMARAADALGMEYLTITDHSPSAHYAGGVTLDRLRRQWDEIARVQETVKVRLLRGTESDILEDGALDYSDAILEQLDIVIASIHSRMKMDADQMTARLVRAMRHPCFKIWGHPLGRLLLRREPFACRVDEVLDAIAESRAAIEINGDPYRLDLAPEHVRAARARGIRFVISTDAHSTRALANLRFGVHLGRRAGLQRAEVLNALPVDEFKAAVRPAASGRPA